MFRHALRPKAFSSSRRPAITVALGLRPYSRATTTTTRAGQHGLARKAVFQVKPRSSASGSCRGIAGLSFDNDTIYALSSAQGRAGIAVIRISGPGCADVYAALCPAKPPPKPRYAAVRTLYEPGSDTNIVDSSALVLSFPGPRTVTGEDVLELHVHGGPATVKAALSAVSKCCRRPPQGGGGGKVRYAEPGEFTRRAFLNDRLDLAQVEALGDALAAETEQQRRAAVRGSSGDLGRTYDGWRARLLAARAEVEALIDFAEDQHLDESPAELLGGVAAAVRGLVRSMRLYEVAAQRTELLRSGIRIALLGPPNAGKSSLMNLIVGREASIVSHEAGTTRDVVEASLDIRGYLCSFADTAGFRTVGSGGEGTFIGAVEEEGIRRARRKAEEADVVVALASVEPVSGGGKCIVYDPETLRLAGAADQRLVVVNKRDAAEDDEEFKSLVSEFKERTGFNAEPLAISCREAAEDSGGGDGDPGGVHALISALVRSFGELTELPSDRQELLGVTERQRQLLAECRRHLEEFMAGAEPVAQSDAERTEPGEVDVVLAAEHLRSAAHCLARITGRGDVGDVEEVLGVIFEKFCVGK